MNKYIYFTDKNEDSCADDQALIIARQFLDSGIEHSINISSSIFVSAIRMLYSEGIYNYLAVYIVWHGQQYLINEEGLINDWPVDLCALPTEFARKILSNGVKTRKEKRNYEKIKRIEELSLRDPLLVLIKDTDVVYSTYDFYDLCMSGELSDGDGRCYLATDIYMSQRDDNTHTPSTFIKNYMIKNSWTHVVWVGKDFL